MMFILLQAAQGGGGMFGSPFILLILMLVVMWLFFIRPQSKKAKEQKKFSEALQKGDKVVTNAGIHGTIQKVNDDNTTVSLEIAPGSFIKIERSAISMEWTKIAYKPDAAATK